MASALLEDWTATDFRRHDGYVAAAYEYRLNPSSCPKCSARRLVAHGTKWVSCRDLPVFGEPSLMKVKARRFRCQTCGATSMQPLPDIDPRRRLTRRCVSYIEDQAVLRPFSDIAAGTGVDEKTVREICADRFERFCQNYAPAAPSILGIDALSLFGRPRRLLVDLEAKAAIDLIEDQNPATFSQWLRLLSDRQRVEIVSMGFMEGERKAVRSFLPNAAVSLAKQNVLALAGAAVEEFAARWLSRRGSGDLNATALLREDAPDLVMTVKHGDDVAEAPLEIKRCATPQHPEGGLEPSTPFRRPKNITRQAPVGAPSEIVLSGAPEIGLALQAKQQFDEIWDAPTRREAERLYDGWKRRIPPSSAIEFGKVATTIDQWRTEAFMGFEIPDWGAPPRIGEIIAENINHCGRGNRFAALRAKALLSNALGAKTFVCAMCRGKLPETLLYLESPHIQPIASSSDAADGLALCAHCHERILREPWLGLWRSSEAGTAFWTATP